MRAIPKKISGYLLLALVIAGAAWFAWPRPVLVDLATVKRGPMEVTIDDEAKTRVRHIYTVSAPVAGKLLRISSPDEHQDSSHHIGDVIKAGETIVAVMQPSIPTFLDVRSREELQAAAGAADGPSGLDPMPRGGVRVLRRRAGPAGAGQPEDRGGQGRPV